jgi:SAM-dependent methyltransferase
MNDPSIAFDSLEYWRKRHLQFLTDIRGVGNAALDCDHNQRIYTTVSAYVACLASYFYSVGKATVLDLGCGTGMLSGAFTSAKLRYTGVDISPTAVALAKAACPAADFVVGNIADLPLQSPFDIIVERTVFIHLVEDRYWHNVLCEVKRLLHPRGVFILIDQIPDSDASLSNNSQHVKFRTLPTYQAKLASLGLRFNTTLRRSIGRHVPLNEHTHIVTHS